MEERLESFMASIKKDPLTQILEHSAHCSLKGHVLHYLVAHESCFICQHFISKLAVTFKEYFARHHQASCRITEFAS